MLYSILSWGLYSRTNVVPPFHSYVSRYFRSAFYRVFFSPSSHFVYSPHNDLLFRGRARQLVYCASGGSRMCFSVLLSEFPAGVNMLFSLYAFVLQTANCVPQGRH